MYGCGEGEMVLEGRCNFVLVLLLCGVSFGITLFTLLQESSINSLMKNFPNLQSVFNQTVLSSPNEYTCGSNCSNNPTPSLDSGIKVGTLALTEKKDHEKKEGSVMESIKNMTTTELARLVITNCRLLTNHEEDQTWYYEHAVKMVGAKRQSQLRTQLFESPILSSNGKVLTYCLNTKAGSTFLKYRLLKKGNNELRQTASNEQLIRVFMVIREPMHRLLSAYLNKFKNCEDYANENTCFLWESFSQNIADFVKRENKTQSNLYNLDIKQVHTNMVSFSDFVSYVIHIYLINDGNTNGHKTEELETPGWTWMHWCSMVREFCFPCAALWKHVVLFENLGEHLNQVFSQYPELVGYPETLAETVRPSKNDERVLHHYDSITDDQLWFLGNVMYGMDYSILPYSFEEFCRSINRSMPLKHF